MILDAIDQVGGIYVVTADHGNAEDMVKRNKKGEPLLDKNGNIQILTSHTLEPVRISQFFFLLFIAFCSIFYAFLCNEGGPIDCTECLCL